MTQVIEKARKRLLEIETEAEQLRLFIEMYETLAGYDPDSERVPEGRIQPVESARLSGAAVGKSSPLEIVTAAKGVIREKMRPLTRSELVRLLTLRGLRIAGGDKSKNVGTIIWRSKQFENVEGKGYWPKEFGPWGESEFNF